MRNLKRSCFFFALLSCLGAGAPAAAAAADPRSVGLADALREALQHNLQIQAAQAKLGESEAARRSARGNFGPSISVDASVMVWDDVLKFEMSSPSADVIAKHGAVLAKYADLMAAMPDMFSFGNLRDQVTAQAAVTVTQPITPLYTVAKGYQIAKLQRDVMRLELASTGDEIVAEVTKAYVGLKRASSAVQIGQSAVEQVAAHLKQAQAFYRAGLVGQNDVLKAELALVEAKQQLIQTQAGEALAQSALALLLGRPPTEIIVPSEEFADPPPRLQEGLEAFVAQAIQYRPELKAMAKRVKMAKNGKDIARWDLLPQIAAIGTYQRNEGQGVMTPKDVYFLGGVLKWKLWEWGATYYKGNEAAYKLKQAQIGEKQLRDGIYLDVKKSFLELRSADQMLEVARTAVASAEENFRIEQAKFNRNANTTTDVLDAQLALTRAKLNHSGALFQWYAARAALVKAVGGGGESTQPLAKQSAH